MNIHPRFWATAALFCASAAPAAAEVELSFETSFAPPVLVNAARAGEAVAIDGDFVLVGAPGDSVRGADAGAVHVWRRTAGVWTFEETIRPLTVQAGDSFGASVAVSDGIALIGAPGNDNVGLNAGLVYVFVHGTTGWSQQQTFSGSLVGPGDAFGGSVAMDGDTAVVGARLDDTHGNNSGAAYVMKRGVSFWGEQSQLMAPNAAANDQFGTSVDVSGDLAVVSSPAANQNGVNSGAVYVFERNGNVWGAGDELPAVGTTWFDAFGQSLATDGSRIVVGAPGSDAIATDAGGAWSFVRSGGSWVVEGAFAPALNGGELLGSSIAIVGDTLLVGAAGEDYANSEDGSVRAAEWGGLAWVPAERTGNPAGGISDALGSSLAVDGDLVVVGVPLVDNGVVDSGAAWLFSTSTEPVGLALCLGDGSGVPCPCDNDGNSGEGCANSTGSGARLIASGEAIVGADSLQLVVLGARPERAGIFIQGNVELGVPFRDGLLCVSEETFRLEVIGLDENGAGSSSVEISDRGECFAGDTRVYQFWYRDPVTSPCGSGSNLSGAVQVQWQ
jgi:FG-GAP repeat protein